MERTEVRFGGFGGQGIVLAGRLLGHAACIHGGHDAVLTQAYGPEARGGASNTDVIIADAPVDYPFVTHPDVLVVLFQEACQRFESLVAPGGLMIVEEDLVRPTREDVRILALPATRMAEALGNRIVMNVVVLGYMLAVTRLVEREAIEATLRTMIAAKALDLDLAALDAGYRLAAEQGVAAS
ncbi:MAG: 2-oxoacid:acceptor oxidoreductase family protein [Pseudomonadales bacterium]|jgi:2-oxoglutarate ferredoxin oxidoreductase subunit gamma|nr:2-oxoacid:acceptor oxidoreductase family protein [Pseudomonadales bacterium]